MFNDVYVLMYVDILNNVVFCSSRWDKQLKENQRCIEELVDHVHMLMVKTVTFVTNIANSSSYHCSLAILSIHIHIISAY